MVPHGRNCTHQWPTLLYRSNGFMAWKVQRFPQQHLSQHGPSECCFYSMIPICWSWPKNMLGLAGPVHQPEFFSWRTHRFLVIRGIPFWKLRIYTFFFCFFGFFSVFGWNFQNNVALVCFSFFFCRNFASNPCLFHIVLFSKGWRFFVHLSCLGFCTPLWKKFSKTCLAPSGPVGLATNPVQNLSRP